MCPGHLVIGEWRRIETKDFLGRRQRLIKLAGEIGRGIEGDISRSVARKDPDPLVCDSNPLFIIPHYRLSVIGGDHELFTFADSVPQAICLGERFCAEDTISCKLVGHAQDRICGCEIRIEGHGAVQKEIPEV